MDEPMMPGNGVVSAILPTLNEAENIDEVLAAVLDGAREAALEIEVLVVDDGSTDGTRDRVRAWGLREPRVRLLAREGERDLSGAIYRGAEAAAGDVVVVMDADLSHPTEEFPALAQAVLAGQCDMAIGSRYVPGGATPGWPIRRRALSRGAAALARLLVAARDPCSGFFAVRKDVLLATGKSSEGFKMGLEILASAGPALRILEVPITFRDRTRGQSKLGARALLAYVRQLARLAGGAMSKDGFPRLGLMAVAGFLADVAVLGGLLRGGDTLQAAQVVSFGVATAVCYLGCLLILRGEEESCGWARMSARFAAVAGLTFFLRGGVVAAGLSFLDTGPTLLAAVLVTAAANLVGALFFVFRHQRRGGDPRLAWRVAALGVSVYLLALRLVYAGQVELIPQEAYYWNYSQHLDLGYLDHPPMVAWLIHLGTLVLGHSELGVRAGAIAVSLIALFFVFRLARDLFGELNACIAALLFAVLPFFFGTGFLMTPDAPLVAFWAGSLYFLERALVRGKPRAWLGAGICIGLGFLSKYTIALVALGALVYVLVDRPSRCWLRSPAPYLAALVTLFFCLPVFLWNAQHGWASFAFQGPKRWQEAPRFELPALLLNMLLLVTPLGLVGFTCGLWRAGRERLFGLVFTLLPISVFIISSLRNETKLNWTGPAWLSALPFMAASIVPPAGGTAFKCGAFPVRIWKPAILALTLFHGALLFHVAGGFTGLLPLPDRLRMSWRDLGRQVEEIEEEILERTGSNPLVVGMDKYNLASQLAFYDPKGDGASETTAKNLFGRSSLMYDFWFPPGRQTGKSLVLVGKTPDVLDAATVRSCVNDLEPVQEIHVRKGGDVVARYFVRVAHGYRDPSQGPDQP
jgi:dolichol-phosphate mannosyltransferase